MTRPRIEPRSPKPLANTLLIRPNKNNNDNNNNDKRIVDFVILADHRLKIKANKKLWNMKVTVIPIVVGVLGTIPKGLVNGLEELEIRGQEKTIHFTALLRSARILRRVLET